MSGRVPSEPGSSPPGQAPAGLVASRGDPSRICSGCGGKIGPKNTSGRCNFCFHGMDRRDDIIAMYREGKPYAEISRVFGVTKQAAYGILKRCGEIRPSGQDHSGTFHARAAERASQRLLTAYQRHFAGKSPITSGWRPSSLAETIEYLDALSRTRALTNPESLRLERCIKEERAERNKRPASVAAQ